MPRSGPIIPLDIHLRQYRLTKRRMARPPCGAPPLFVQGYGVEPVEHDKHRGTQLRVHANRGMAGPRPLQGEQGCFAERGLYGHVARWRDPGQREHRVQTDTAARHDSHRNGPRFRCRLQTPVQPESADGPRQPAVPHAECQHVDAAADQPGQYPAPANTTRWHRGNGGDLGYMFVNGVDFGIEVNY